MADAGSQSSGFGRWLLVLAAGLVVVCVLGYRVLNRNQAALAVSNAASTPAEPAATATATITPTEPTAAASAAEAPAAPSEAPASAAPAAESASSPAAADSAPAPAASAFAAPSADTEIRRVTIKSKPPKVRFFHFGKQVGVTPFVLELKPGERHAYEAGLPGYGTRKVVIDGSKPEVLIGLTREKP